MLEAEYVRLFEEITKQTNNDLILFFIIVAVVIIIVMFPLYTMVLKDRKHKNQHETDRLTQYMEREKRIIEVITANTTIMAGLKTTLEMTGSTTNTSLTRIHDRVDNQVEVITRIAATIDESIRNQGFIKEDVKKLLMLISEQGSG